MINVQIVGDRVVAARFLHLSKTMQGQMAREMRRLAILLQRVVKMSKLSGQVLNVRTGTLRRSITYEIEQFPGIINAIVGTNVKYGATHELGWEGDQTVKAHMRRVKSEMKGKLKKGKGEGSIQVGTFTRYVKIPERSFLRSALREMSPLLKREMAHAASRVLAGGTL